MKKGKLKMGYDIYGCCEKEEEKVDELKDEIQNLAFENKVMAEFIESQGVKVDELIFNYYTKKEEK